jgi:hypothetical protein
LQKLISEEQITDNIANYLSQNKVDEKVSLIDAYNNWSTSSGVIIEDKDLVEFAIRKISEMIGLDENLLEEAIKISNTQKELKGGLL